MNRVLVIRRRYLGDIVLLGSFLKNLRLHWPDARLSVLTEAIHGSVLALNPDVDEALAMPRGAAGWVGFLRRLRAAHFTHVFNFDNTEGTALVARATGAPFRCGVHHGGHPLKLRAGYTHPVNHPNAEHETHPFTEYYLYALASAGVPIATREVRLVPREDDVAEMRRFVGAPGPVLLVHPGSRSSWRVWPVERFAEVCDRAQDELGAQVVLVGGPADREWVEAIRGKARSHLLAWDQPLSLPRFAALASLATVLLCHDSGPMHVAAAVGTPVVALFGSQNAVLFAPAGQSHIVIQPSLPCRECVAPQRCTPGDSYLNLCVRRNPVDRVFAAVRTQWERAAAARAPA